MKSIYQNPSILLAAAAVLFTLAPQAGAEEAKKGTLEVGGLTFHFNSPWSAKETPRPMSQGGITQPSEENNQVSINADFYHFGRGQGGSVQANVQRWVGQFQGDVESSTHTIKAGDSEITLVQVTGTFLDGPPLGQKVSRPDYGLLGAIIDRPSEGSVFIKLTGPAADLDDMDEEFEAIVRSAFPE